MKHVREPLPDVQQRRPEISAALAAVVERATAKETAQPLRRRVDEMVHDLEQVLAIEAARAGETTGEATTVLRSLPGDTADFAPRAAAPPAPGAAAGPARARRWSAARRRLLRHPHREGPGAGGRPRAPPGLTDVKLGSRRGRATTTREGDGEESADATQSRSTATAPTELGHRDLPGRLRGRRTRPASASTSTPARPVAAKRLDLVTSTPGFTRGGLRRQHRARATSPAGRRSAARSTVRAGPGLKLRHRRAALPLLPALDQSRCPRATRPRSWS